MLAGNDVNSTWEGDNNVLLQQTAKFLLDQFNAKMKGKEKQTVTCQWVKIDDVTEDKCTAETIDQLLSPEQLLAAFGYRCNKNLQRTAQNIGMKMASKEEEFFQIWNDEQIFGAQELALSYGDYSQVMMDTIFINKISGRESKYLIFLKDDSKEILNLLFRLSALHRLQRNIGDFFEYGYFTPEHGAMIRSEIKVALTKMKRFTVALTDTMLPADDQLDSMIAPADGDLYKSIQNKIYSAPGVFDRIENWKDLVKK